MTTRLMTYTMTYGESDNCVPGTITLVAKDDKAATDAARQYVQSGFRNGSWAFVPLRSGAVARFSNQHGQAFGGVCV